MPHRGPAPSDSPTDLSLIGKRRRAATPKASITGFADNRSAAITTDSCVEKPRTFKDAVELWLRVVEFENQRASTTVRGYRAYVERMLIPEFDGPLDEVTAERIDRYRRRLRRRS